MEAQPYAGAVTPHERFGPERAVMVAETELRPGALRLPGVLMMRIKPMAPATALLFTIQFTTTQAGLTAPLAYLAAFPIVIVLGVCLMQLARYLPSAGGYYTYISRTVHPRAGFLSSWLYFLYDPTVAGFVLAFIGYVLEQVLKTEYGVTFPWWLFLLVAGSFVAFVTYRGIELSAKVLVLFGTAEVAITLLLSCWGFFQPGLGGDSFAPFNPSHATSSNGFFLAVVFSIFAFNGWEGVAPLAEESENPRQNVPRAILISILLMGAFLILGAWGLLVGWGTDRLPAFISSQENPTFVLAHTYWGKAWLVVLLALLNSMLAVAIAANNAATRVWFAMSRSGSLPRTLAAVHPKYKTPVNGVKLQTVLTFAVGLGLGWWIGPAKEFEFMGTMLTFALILTYSAANLGVFLYYFRERREDFRVILHAIFPAVGTLALFFVAYHSLTPWPSPPLAYTPWVVLIWLALGVLVLLAMRLAGKEEWLAEAGRTARERVETAEEMGHRPIL